MLDLWEAGVVPTPPPNTRALPLYPGAVVMADTQSSTIGSTQRIITLRTDASATQVLAFYDHALLLAGWQSDVMYRCP